MTKVNENSQKLLNATLGRDLTKDVKKVKIPTEDGTELELEVRSPTFKIRKELLAKSKDADGNIDFSELEKRAMLALVQDPNTGDLFFDLVPNAYEDLVENHDVEEEWYKALANACMDRILPPSDRDVEEKKKD